MILDSRSVVTHFNGEGSAAEAAGVALGSRILRVNQLAVDSKDDVVSELGRADAGSVVEFLMLGPGPVPGVVSDLPRSPGCSATLQQLGGEGQRLNQPSTKYLTPAPVTVKSMEELLHAASLAQYTEALRGLGCVVPEDLSELQEADMMELGMKRLEVKRLLRSL